MSPRFSCVIPVKGARPYLDEALESLRSQGLGYNLVDHRSATSDADAELEIIIQDGDVEPDSGQSDALNRGFAKAHGEWLFWLNADDVLLPGALGRVCDAITRRNGRPEGTEARGGVGERVKGKTVWIAGNLVYLDAEGKVVKCAADRGCRLGYEGFPVRVYGPSSFFRRELFEKSGGFDTACRFSMDTELWCKFRQLGYWYAKIPDYLWGFRMHAGSLTAGDLVGKPPAGMDAECRRIDARYHLKRAGFRKFCQQTIRFLEGSYFKSALDTVRLRGRSWHEVTAS